MTIGRRLRAVVLPVCVGTACGSDSGDGTGGSTHSTNTSAGGADTYLPTTSSSSSTTTSTSGSSSTDVPPPVPGDGGEASTMATTGLVAGTETTGSGSSATTVGEPGATSDADPSGETADITGSDTTAGREPGPAPGDTNGGGEGEPPDVPDNATDVDLLVALVGDQGTGSNAKAVYELMLGEGADLVILLGDYDYEDDPDKWAEEMTAVLGDSFPVFGVIGNHDVKEWSGYQAVLEQRLQNIPGASCEGDLGVRSSCTYRGLHFVLSGLGVKGSDADHEAHIADALAADDSLWSLCVMHKNMRDLQAGDKPDDLTWPALQSCQADGSIIVMGHEHSYARTRTLTDIGDHDAGHGAVGDPELLEVGPGSTFSACSGLGGKSIRAYESLHDDDTWWGTLYTSDRYVKNGVEVDDFAAEDGALFVRFHVDGDPGAAHGYFKNVAGDIIDEFEIVHD